MPRSRNAPGGLIPVLLLFSAAAAGGEPNYASVLNAVAQDIAALKHDRPQLEDFSPDKHMDRSALSISYGYRTHRIRGAGWTAGVPNPDADGIWFYIDLHDPNSNLQIHTQPADPVPSCIGEKRVSFLILEGTDTKKIAGPIGAILQRRGLHPCDQR